MKNWDTLKKTVKEEDGQLINYTIGSDATPICVGFGSICLKTGYQKWLSVVKESNDDKTSLFLLTALQFSSVQSLSCSHFFRKRGNF